MAGDVLARLANGLHPAGDRAWTARCPAHDDHRNSLSIGCGADGRWLLNCHAGCSVNAIVAAVGLTLGDLFPERQTTRRIAATYRYCDERGALLFDVVRYEPKDFRARAADGSWSIKGVRRVLYRLPELQGRATVFLVEGERDADRLWTCQLPATTSVGGAGKWRDDYAAQLKAAACHTVIVLPDHDAPGETHGRQVARSCHDAGLAVKFVPLPGLPDKGDVSDFLAHQTPGELIAIVDGAPFFNPATRVTVNAPLTLTSLADLLDEPDEPIDWILENRIPAGGIVLLAAPPKAGKSTLARELALCVATGSPFLGWSTTPGRVWYFAFQDKRKEIKRHFRRLGAAHDLPLELFIDQAPADVVSQISQRAADDHPVLIVIDMLAHVLQLKDFNDYGQATRALTPLLELSRATGAALLLLHHGSAHATREGIDAVLNSTAISGSVDNVMVLKRADQLRTIATIQRIGPDLVPTILTLDPDAGRLALAGNKQQYDDAELRRNLLAVLKTANVAVPEATIQAGLAGRKQDMVRALRFLVGVRQVERSGGGKKGDPYVYRLVDDAGPHAQNAGSQRSSRAENAVPALVNSLWEPESESRTYGGDRSSDLRSPTSSRHPDSDDHDVKAEPARPDDSVGERPSRSDEVQAVGDRRFREGFK